MLYIILVLTIIFTFVVRKNVKNYSMIIGKKNNNKISFDNIILDKQEIIELNKRLLIKKNKMNNLDNIYGFKYGLIIKKAEIKKNPNEEVIEPINKNIISAISYGNGVIILKEENNYYYCKCYNYKGWIKKEFIALCSKDEMMNYINNNNFVIALYNNIIIDNYIELNMGDKIPIIKEYNNSYKLLFIYEENNSLIYQYKYIKKGNLFYKGYLPYNSYNIIQMSLKMLNEPYVWGYFDCSYFILSIFKTFGIYLPRDTFEQKNSFQKYFCLVPGSLIYTNGHVMLYIGEKNSDSYVIHNSYSNKKVCINKIKTKEYKNIYVK